MGVFAALVWWGAQLCATEALAETTVVDIPQAATEFRVKQTELSDLPIPDAPPVRMRGGSAHFKITHYTLSSDGKQLLVETYRLAAPSASVNISHTTKVLRSDTPYHFREGRELLRFGMDAEGMRILRFERYTINPATGEASLSQTHYPAEQP